MNNTAKILTGIVAGIAAGAIFAPDKGSEIRKKINQLGKKIADEVKDRFYKFEEQFNCSKEGIKKAVKEKAEEFA